MKWEDEKQLVRDAVEKVFKIGEERGTQDLKFSCEMHLDYPPQFEYEVGMVLIPEREAHNG